MKNYHRFYKLYLSVALATSLVGSLQAQEAYSSVGANYGKVYNSTGSASSKNYGSSTSSSDLTSAQQSGLTYSDPGTTVNQTTANSVSSGYTGSAPSNLTSGFSASTLAPPGRSKITDCAATGTSSTNTNTECNAVNFMASNPGQNLTVSSADPILTNAANTLSGATTTAVTSSSVCTTQNAIVPATNSTETCNDYYSEYTSTCTRVLNQSYGYSTLPFSVDNGSQVPENGARTFTYTATLNGVPRGVMLNYYQADNYGQLWVNGALVMSNVLPGMTDLRNGYISSGPLTCNDDGCYSDAIFVNADGSSTSFYDDGCNWGCRGTSPNTDISSYFHAGTNEIVMACANQLSIGPCAVNITMQAYGIVSSSWINNCLSQEALVK